MACDNEVCLASLARSIAASATVPRLSLPTLHTTFVKMDAPQDQHALSPAMLHVIQDTFTLTLKSVDAHLNQGMCAGAAGAAGAAEWAL